jgi:hypothetical protein
MPLDVGLSGDRPARSSDVIEVTPAMIEAGYRILVASGITDDPLEADKLLVRENIRCHVSLSASENATPRIVKKNILHNLE